MSSQLALLAWLILIPLLRAAEPDLVWSDLSLLVQDQSQRLDVYYQGMRLNRATGHWDVEVWLHNRSAESVRTPVALVLTELAGSPGPVRSDGEDAQGRPFVDFSQAITNGVLGPGERSGRRVVSLRRVGDLAPRLGITPYGRNSVQPKALATTRSMDAVGLPLGDVEVQETGPGGSRTMRTEAGIGVVTLGGEPGSYSWKFSRTGYLPVWRNASLARDQVAVIPNPKLTLRSAAGVMVNANGAEVRSPDGAVTLRVASGVFAEPTRLTLTSLHAQALPAFLPPGWSPLRAFWFETEREPSSPVPLTLALPTALRSVEQAHLARWETGRSEWVSQGTLAGSGVSLITTTLAGTGAYCLVIADPAPGGPPVPAIGDALRPSAAPIPLPSPITVEGVVTPPTAVANLLGEQVTTLATLVVSHVNGSLSSGSLVRGRVAESYALSDRSTRHPPRYDVFQSLYQRPGDTEPATLHAMFPLRPLLLLGAEELTEARVKMDVLLPEDFAGGVIDAHGGLVDAGGVRVLAGPGDLDGTQAVLLEQLDFATVAELVPSGATLSAAVELTVSGVNPGHRLSLRFGPQPSRRPFLIARVLARDGLYGLEPVERLNSDDAGRLVSAEPAGGERLPGVTTAGQFVLLQLPSDLTLISGIARGPSGQAATGCAVRSTGQPWLTFTDHEGRYLLLAALGDAEFTFLDPAGGGIATVPLTIVERVPVSVPDTTLGPVGLRVLGVTPSAGSQDVPRVTAVTARFSKPVNAGTLVGSGIQLLDAAGQPVAASVSLNLRNTVVTLLPNTQLAPATLHILRLAASVLDSTGSAIQGPLEFTFKTASDVLDRSAAQLTSHEPEGGRAKIVGSPGTAEPEAPVLLVNETTGRTATVLSRADGSFENFIEAETDDDIHAVVVNRNGTQTRVPVSRQLFRDGRVGLFRGGGILEAQTDGGPVQVLVEPGAVSGKARFKLDTLPLAELLAAVKNTPPENSRLLGGLRVTIEGDPLATGADLSFPVGPVDLALPAGERPEDRAFVLCEPIQQDGVTVYRLVDTLQYENGRLVSHSPPFEGIAFSMMVTPIMTSANAGQLMNVSGFVVSAPASIAKDLDSEAVHTALQIHSDQIRPVPGTIVSAYPASLAGQAIARAGLAPGTFVARANTVGFFAIQMPFNAFEHDAIMLLGENPRLPGLRTSRSVPRPAFRYAVSAQLVFALPEGGAAIDRFPPLIQPQPPTLVLPVNADVIVPIVLRDDQSLPRLTQVSWNRARSISLPSGEPLDHALEIRLERRPAETLNDVSVIEKLFLRVPEPMQVAVDLEAIDASGNRRNGTLLLNFGATPPAPPETIPPNNPDDLLGPQVIASLPHEGAVFSSSETLTILFNEPVRRLLTRRGPGGGFPGLVLRDTTDEIEITVLRSELSVDQRTLQIAPGPLKPGHDFDLELNAGVLDLVDNALDQFPSLSGNSPFHLRFRTAAAEVQILAGTDAPQGTVLNGPWAFTIDRGPSLGNGFLRVHRLDADPITLLITNLPPFPRALLKIPSYAFRRTPTGPTETNALLVVVGGLAGSGQPGQWMQVWNISNPEVDFAADAPISPLVAGGFVSIDPHSPITVLKWNAPRLAFLLNTPNGSLIQMVNLQAFILGPHYSDEEWNALPKPPTYDPGRDSNGDGDFVDTELDPPDRLPVPVRFSLHGLERTVQPAPGLYLSDFDVALGGSLVVGTLLPHDGLPGRLQVFSSDGLPTGDGLDLDGGLEFPDERPLRVTLDLDFPLTVGPARENRPVALVATGGTIAVVDLRNPLRPELSHRIPFATDPGTIGMIERTAPNEYAVGTAHGIFLLARSRMGEPAPTGAPHPAFQEHFDVPLSGRTAGVSSRFVASSDGSQARAIARPPTFNVAHLGGGPVRDASAVALLPEAEIRAFLASLRPGQFLAPAVVKSENPNVPSGIEARSPDVHQYVLLEAPGSAGPTVAVAVESLDRNGNLVAPKGRRYPPVMLTGHAQPLMLDGVQPDVTALVARRLSDHPSSDLYNYFLSDPFVVVREPTTSADRQILAAIPGRQAVWSGRFLRVSLDATAGLSILDDHEGKVAEHRYIAGVSRTYLTLDGEYIDSPNPSLPGAAPTVAGVDLQSGELRESAVDLTIEGRHQDLVFSRVYESRSRYAGILGHGWDFNLHARIQEIPETLLPSDFSLTSAYFGNQRFDRAAHPGDAFLIDGNGSSHIFKRISSEAGNLDKQPLYANDPAIAAFGWADKIARFYESPPGQFGVLYKFLDSGFVFVSTSGTRTYYDGDGRLDRVVGSAEASVLQCEYADDGRLSRVRGDRNLSLVFDYRIAPWEPGVPIEVRRDEITTNTAHFGLLRRIRTAGGSGLAREVRFDYDDEGRLTLVTDPSGRSTVYGYDEGRLVSIGRGDGAGFPAQKIHYTNGMVDHIIRDGRTTQFSGAKEKASERYVLAEAPVSVKHEGAAAASMVVDQLGRPMKFANMEISADDDGRRTRTSDAQGTSGLFYDTANLVHRFRGNLLGTVQEGRASYWTTNVYDGTAWNRLSKTVDDRGVTNQFTYEVAGRALTAIVETSGPIERRSTLDEYGQVQSVELKEGGFTLTREILYADGLAEGERVGDLPETHFARSEAGAFSATRHGQPTYNTTPNDDGQVTALSGPQLPAMGFGYDKGALTNASVTADGASRSVGVAYSTENRARLDQITIAETGLAQPLSASVHYDNAGRVSEVVSAGETNGFTYDGTLLTRYQAPGIDRQVTYDDKRVTNVIEQGISLGLTYDNEGRIRTTVSRGLTKTFRYHRGGVLANRNITAGDRVLSDETYGYDGAGRLSSVIAGNARRRFDYFPDGVIRRSWLNDRLIKETSRDLSGRPTAVLIPGLVRTEFSDFDAITGLAQREESKLYLSDPTLPVGTFISLVKRRTYDDASRVQKLSLPCGDWTYGFDAFGHLLKITDPDGVSRSFTSTPGGLPLSATFEDGTTATFAYDATFRLERKGDLTYGRGLSDRIVDRVTYPDSTTLRYGQKNAFNQHDLVFQGGLVQQLTWVEGRLEGVVSGPDSVNYGFDRLGRLTRVQSQYRMPGGVTAQCDVTFGFDSKGQPSAETNRMNLGDTPVRSWTGTFDDENRFTGETYPSGLSITWESYDHGQPKAAPAVGITRIAWVGPGELGAVEYSSGLRVIHGLDASLRRTNITYERGPASNPIGIAGFDYGFSGGGRVLWERRRHDDRFDVFERNGPAEGMRIRNFRFSATGPDGSGALAAIEGLRFNVHSELLPPTNRIGSDPRAFLPDFELTNDLRLASADGVPVTYDPDWGSVDRVPVWVRLPGQTTLTREIATLHYDGFGMVRSVERGTGADRVTVSYVRDGRGRFVRRIVEGPPNRCRPGVRQYAWRRDQLIEEHEATPDGVHLLRRYVYVGQHLVLIQSAASPGGPLADYVPIVSLNRSVGGFLTTSGDLVEVIRYGAYGTPVTCSVQAGQESERDSSAIGPTLLFQGAWYDEDTGLYQLGERNLHPQLGRFLQRDSVLYANSRALFAAFNGDPAGRVDPSGAESTLLTPALNEFQNNRYNAADLWGKTEAFSGAVFANEGLTGATRVGSVLSSGPDFVNASMKFMGAFLDEEFKADAERLAPALDSMKLMGDIVQTAGQMQERRALLSAIQAHMASPFKSVQASFLHHGGALADLQVLGDDLWDHEDVQKASAWRRDPDKLGEFLDDRRRDFRNENAIGVIKLAHGITKLGASFAERYLNTIEDPETKRYRKGLLDVAKAALDMSEKVIEVVENKALSSTQFALNAASARTLLGEVLGAKSYLMASFDIGYTAGASAIIAFTAPEVSQQYQKDKALFEQFGGFIGLGATLLQDIGMKQVGRFIESAAVDPGFMKAGRQAMEQLGAPHPSMNLYLNGLEAP